MMDYYLSELMVVLRMCIQSLVDGSKKMVIEKKGFTVTAYQMGLKNIRIDIKDNNTDEPNTDQKTD